MADALRGSMDAAEYKHVVLGLIFLKYTSDAFEEQHAKLVAEKSKGAEPEDPDEYRALSIFWVPPEARWPHVKAHLLGGRSQEARHLDPFLAEVRGMPHRNLAVELLQKLLRGELATRRRKNVTIDWTLRENVRAQLRVLVKRILRKYGYPPDKQEKATQTVLEQAEALSAEWAVA